MESHVPRRWEPTRPGVDIHRRQAMLEAIGACQEGNIEALKAYIERELTDQFSGMVIGQLDPEGTAAAVLAAAKAQFLPVVGAHVSADGTTIVLEFPPEHVMTPQGFG